MRRWWALALAIGLVLPVGGAALLLATLPSIGALATENPGTTALIELRKREAEAAGRKPRRRQHWVPLSGIAPVAVQAVLISEDARFWQHGGFDFGELQLALGEAWTKKKLGRGASTITQQLAKNLWLGEERDLLRKAKELLLARRLEQGLEKRRILAIYLNVIEWGPGVYGIEAAAREHFGRSAAVLSPGEAAILAAMLPAPRRWLPASRPRALERRSLRIVDRLLAAGRIDAGQAEEARSFIGERLGRDA